MQGNAKLGAAIGALSMLVSVATFLALHSVAPAPASQGSAFLPTTGTYTGLQAANTINNALDALLTCNKGNVAPTNALGGSPKAGQCWLDDSTSTLLIKKRYSGAGWVVEGVIDVTNGIWSPPVGGGIGSATAASTTDLCAAPQAVINVAGNTTITSFGTSCVTGTKKTLVFGGALSITYNATSMIAPGAANVPIVAGDVVEATALGSGNWRITSIAKIDGSAIVNPAMPLGTVLYGMFATLPPKTVNGYGQALVRADYPAYLAAVTRAQTGTRTSGNATITSVADTSKMGAGMPIEGTGLTGCVVSSVTVSTIVLTNGACVGSSGTATVTVFFTGYGSGGDTTKVGVPDCRGRTLAGVDTGTGRLTATYFGISAAALNVANGDEKRAIGNGNLPANIPNSATTNTTTTTSTVFDNPQPFAGSLNGANYQQGSLGLFNLPTGSIFTPAMLSTSTSTSTTTVTINAGGANTPLVTVQPTLIAECAVVVLP